MNRRIFILLCAITLAFPCLAVGQFTWVGTGPDDHFTTGGNWIGGTAPTALVAADIDVAEAIGNFAIDQIDLDYTDVRGLTFTDALGGPATLTGTGSFGLVGPLSQESNVRVTLDVGLELMDDVTISTLKSGLTINGEISEQPGVFRTLTLDATGGAITLNGAGTYNGGTVLNGGRIQIGSGAPFGTGTIVVSSPSRLRTLMPITMFNNSIQLDQKLTLEADASLIDPVWTFTKPITGTGALAFEFEGTAMLSEANSYAGGTMINGQTIVIVDNNQAFGTGDVTVKKFATLQSTSDQRMLANNFALNNGGLLTLSGSRSIALGGVISGNGGTSIDVDSGKAVTMTAANTYTGPTDIRSGKLVVAGQLSADSMLTVHNTGTLAGTGTVGPTEVLSGGRVQPGTTSGAVGTLTIQGDYVQQVGSHFDVNAVGTSSDVISVNGMATLNGGQVHVSGAPTPGDFAILQATTTTGTGFQSIDDTLALMTARLNASRTGVEIRLDPTNFDALAQTANQHSVAFVLDAASPTAVGEAGSDLLTIRQLSDSEITAALGQIGGEIYGSLPSFGRQLGNDRFRNLSQNLQTLRAAAPRREGYDGGTSVLEPFSPTWEGDDAIVRGQSRRFYALPRPAVGWWSGFGYGGAADSPTVNSTSLRYTVGGGNFGVGWGLSENTLAGMFGSIAGAKIGTVTHDGRVESTNFEFGGYLTKSFERAYWILAAGYGVASNESSRQIQLGAEVRHAQGDFTTQLPGGYAEAGVTVPFGALALQPYVAMNYLHYDREAFTEQGAGALNLSLPRDNVDFVSGIVGSRAVYQTQLANGGQLILQGSSHLRFAAQDLNEEFLGTLGGISSNSFLVQGTGLSGNLGVVSGSLGWQFHERAMFYVSYTGQAGSRYQSHGGYIGEQWIW